MVSWNMLAIPSAPSPSSQDRYERKERRNLEEQVRKFPQVRGTPTRRRSPGLSLFGIIATRGGLFEENLQVESSSQDGLTGADAGRNFRFFCSIDSVNEFSQLIKIPEM